MFQSIVKVIHILASILATILAAILETINSMKLIVAEYDFQYPKIYVLIPRTQLHLVCEPRYEVKLVLANILDAILVTIIRMKLEVAENDSSYPQMYVRFDAKNSIAFCM